MTSSNGIHPTATIEDGASLGKNVLIGPFCYVGGETVLGDDVRLKSHVVVEGRTRIGDGTVVHPFAVLGGTPQHLSYRDENTSLIIGKNNIIREHVTMNVATAEMGGVTEIGSNSFFMTGAHVAHDCRVGDNVIFANNATLGGHVVVEEGAFLGGLCAVHQFCRVGAFSFIGGCAAVPTDVIPYGSAIGNHAELAGLNIIGMKRRGIARSVIFDVRDAYKILFSDEGSFSQRLADVTAKHRQCPEVDRILKFIHSDTKRPLMAPRR